MLNPNTAANAKWLKKVKWDEQGLVPVIAQEASSGDVLMFAWMNRDALYKTVELGEAVYWSRSRKKLWHKGEESGHTQKVLEIRLDCDEDVILLKIEQAGGIACHTGRHACFFNKFEGNAPDGDWAVTEPVLQDPDLIYAKKAVPKAAAAGKTAKSAASKAEAAKPDAAKPDAPKIDNKNSKDKP